MSSPRLFKGKGWISLRSKFEGFIVRFIILNSDFRLLGWKDLSQSSETFLYYWYYDVRKVIRSMTIPYLQSQSLGGKNFLPKNILHIHIHLFHTMEVLICVLFNFGTFLSFTFEVFLDKVTWSGFYKINEIIVLESDNKIL